MSTGASWRNVPAAGRDFDVIIVGGGVIGAAMACVLLARGLVPAGRVALVGERLAPPAESLDWDARVFALSRASQRLLKIGGAWSLLPAHKRHAYERMAVWDASTEPGQASSLRFDCAELGEPNLGFIVEGPALLSACLRAAGDAGAVLIEAAVADASGSATGARIRLNDGRDMAGRLLIAADGTESPTRRLLGVETAGHGYDQDALVAHVRTAKPHANTAWQRFLPSGPLALLPLPDGRSSLVWSTPRAEAARMRTLDAEAFGAALTAASGGVLGACELTTAVSSFPLKLQYALDYVGPHAVLLGDAAHVVHPLAGQGLNIGLLDVATLADVLGEQPRGELGERRILRRYERRRRSENLLMATALDALERLFSNDNPVLSGLRVAGLRVVNGSGPVKRRLAERALGLSGDVPAFLREKSASATDAN